MNLEFDQARQCITMVGDDLQMERQLDQDFNRVPGVKKWLVPPVKLTEKAKSLLSAVTSGFASPEVVALRRLSCFGPPSCPMMVEDKTGRYCGLCRCSRWKLADLDGTLVPKLGWKVLNCPLRRPGFTNSTTR